MSSKFEPIPNNEEKRLEALRSYDVLDSIPEKEFDDLTQLASYIAGTPIALVSLIDKDRQWFKSKVGLEAEQTPRNISFCQHAIMNDEIFEVSNAIEHPLFKDNPLVTGAPDIRQYHGVPLKTPAGYNVGTLCVISPEPGELNEQQKEALIKVANQVVSQLEIRKKNQQLEEILTESRNIFNLSLDLICIAGTDGYFKKLNPAFSQVLGFTIEELLSKPFFDFIHPDDIAATNREIGNLAKGELTINFKVRFRCKNGTYRIFSWKAAPDVETGMLYCVARDITEQERLDRYRTAELSAINSAVLKVELSPDRAVLSANKNFLDLVGYSENELIGKKHESLVGANEKSEKEYTSFWRALEDGNAQNGEFKRVSKNGDEIWIRGSYIPVLNVDGSVERIIKVAYDITESKIQQNNLERLTSLQNGILNGTNFSIISTDKDGIITTFNSGAENLLGYKAEELVNKQSPAVFHDLNEVVERAGVLTKELGENIDPGFEVFVVKARINDSADENEWTYITKEGKKIPVILSVTALKDNNGNLLGYLGVAKDISKEKQYLDKIENQNKELDQFSYVVSHDLKAPLRAINTLSEFIEEDLEGKLDGDTKHNFQLLRNRTEQMQNLISDILEYSKIGRDQIEVTVVHSKKLIEEVVERLNISGDFEVELCNDLPELKTQKVFLDQIFSNLISNAIKYNDKDKGLLQVLYSDDSEMHRFEFKDNGPGIEPRYHNKVFEIFQTLEKKDDVDSTGIGLSTVKKIVEDMKGEIFIESELGKGASFIVQLPKN